MTPRGSVTQWRNGSGEGPARLAAMRGWLHDPGPLPRGPTPRSLRRARAGDEGAFALIAERFRELQVHCYRMVGSVQDAEDLVQETLMAAWRAISRFEGRSSSRSGRPYRIATNRCLNALRDRGRRAPGPPAPPPEVTPLPPVPNHLPEPVWLEPYPDALIGDAVDESAGPDARDQAREAVALAFMIALQRLPPRQRAALVLRDVLGFSAREGS